MIAVVAASTTPICVFALGCALIHAARDDAATVTQLLTGVTVIALVLFLFGASLTYAPSYDFIMDDVTGFGGE